MEKQFHYMGNDVCVGDTIRFEEGVFSGSFRNAKFKGMREITAKVLKESYGEEKQQHTFTLEVIAATGEDSDIPVGKKIRRKGRNIYRHDVGRLLWDDESERDVVIEEKHRRGSMARRLRDERIKGGY